MASLLLFGIVASCKAQSKSIIKTTSVSANKTTFLKTDNSSFRFITYSNSDEADFKTASALSANLYDTKAVLSFPRNKTIYIALEKTLQKSQIKGIENESVIFMITFTKEIKPISITFMIPRGMNILPAQLEVLENDLKTNLTGKAIKFEEVKKYAYYTIRVPLSKIVDGTYFY